MSRTYQTTEIQNELANRLAKLQCSPNCTFAGKWWGLAGKAERFYFGDSAAIKKNGKRIRSKVWLQFDDPATLEGCSLRVETKKAWHKATLAEWHMPAFICAVELVDPASAQQLRDEIEAARREDEPICDMVGGEDY